GVFMMDWSDYGEVRATTRIDFVQEDIVGEVTANFRDLAPLEALIPLADDVQGRLAADIQISGRLQQPDVVGQLNLVDGVAKLPRLGEIGRASCRERACRAGVEVAL